MSFVLSGLALLLALQAPKAPQGAVSRPPAELSQLRTFVGTWTCDGKSPAVQGAPERRVRATVKIAPDLDGFWYSVRYEEAESGGLRGQAYWGYDPAARHFVETAIDNAGGVGSSTSPGWQVDRFVWTGDVVLEGSRTSVRDTFSKRGPEILHSSEAEIDGKWTLVLQETCRAPVH
jgi:hypothetical protein